MQVREVVARANEGDVRATGERIAAYVTGCRQTSLSACARSAGVGSRALTAPARGEHKPAIRTLVALWEEGGRVLDLHWLLTGDGQMLVAEDPGEGQCDFPSEVARIRALARALGMTMAQLLGECGWPTGGAAQGTSYVSCDVLWYLHRRWPNLDLQWVVTGTRCAVRHIPQGSRVRVVPRALDR